MSLGSDLWVLISLKSLEDYFADLIDVTLADEETNSIPNDEAKRAIGCVSGNVQIFFAFP